MATVGVLGASSKFELEELREIVEKWDGEAAFRIFPAGVLGKLALEIVRTWGEKDLRRETFG